MIILGYFVLFLRKKHNIVGTPLEVLLVSTHKCFYRGISNEYPQHVLWRALLMSTHNNEHMYFMENLRKYPRIIIAPACSRVGYRRPIFRPSVCPSVRQSVPTSGYLRGLPSAF